MKTLIKNRIRAQEVIVILGATIHLQAGTFTVTTTNISGPGSLPAAIAQANATPGRNRIEYTITD